MSRNNFVCQILADASGIHVERAKNSESSVMGAAYAAGLNFGIWKQLDDIRQFRSIERLFEPQTKNYCQIRERMDVWLKAVDRFCHWY